MVRVGRWRIDQEVDTAGRAVRVVDGVHDLYPAVPRVVQVPGERVVKSNIGRCERSDDDPAVTAERAERLVTRRSGRRNRRRTQGVDVELEPHHPIGIAKLEAGLVAAAQVTERVPIRPADGVEAVAVVVGRRKLVVPDVQVTIVVDGADPAADAVAEHARRARCRLGIHDNCRQPGRPAHAGIGDRDGDIVGAQEVGTGEAHRSTASHGSGLRDLPVHGPHHGQRIAIGIGDVHRNGRAATW